MSDRWYSFVLKHWNEQAYQEFVPDAVGWLEGNPRRERMEKAYRMAALGGIFLGVCVMCLIVVSLLIN